MTPTNTLATLTDALHACQVAITQLTPMTVWKHRNGETEPPTEAGLYWYRVEYYVADDDEPSIFEHLFTVRPNVNEPEKWWAFDWNKHPQARARDVSKLQGQWWGPVIMPWEAQQAASVAQTNALAHVQDALRLVDQLQTRPTWEPITDASMIRTVEIIIDGLDEYAGCRLCRLVQPQEDKP